MHFILLEILVASVFFIDQNSGSFTRTLSSSSSNSTCQTVEIVDKVGNWVNSAIDRHAYDYTSCTFNFSTAIGREFDCRSDLKDLKITIKIIVSPEADKRLPLIFTIRQQREYYKILKLPFTYEDEVFTNISNFAAELEAFEWFHEVGLTLCVDQGKKQAGHGIDSELLITVETPGGIRQTVQFGLLVTVHEGLFLKLSHYETANDGETTVTTVLSPMVSTFYGFDFSDESNNGVENVTVLVTSLEPNPPCTMISIQTPFCPMDDMERTIRYEGKFQPMLRQGMEHVYQWEMSKRIDSFEGGFALVIVVLSDDSPCKTMHDDEIVEKKAIITSDNNPYRQNQLKIQVYSSRWDKNQPNRLVLWLSPFIMIWLISSVIVSLSIYWRMWNLTRALLAEVQDPVYEVFGGIRICLTPLKVSHYTFNIGLNEPNGSNHLWDIVNSNMHYFIGLFIVIIARILALTRTTGDPSNCYYNNKCAYQIQFFVDNPLSMKFYEWNAVISSLTFTLGGLILFVYLHLRKLVGRDRHYIPEDENVPLLIGNAVSEIDYGIPNKLGLDFALAVMLILKGVVSAMYHVCPNLSSYLLDSPCTDMLHILAWIRVCHIRRPSYMTPMWTTVVAVGSIILDLFISLGHYSHQGTALVYLCFYYAKLLLLEMLVILHTFYIYYVGYYQSRTNNIIEENNEGVGQQTFQTVTNLRMMLTIWGRRFRRLSWRQVIRPDRPLDFVLNIVQFSINTFVILQSFAWFGYELDSDDVLLLIEANIMFVIVVHFIRKLKEGIHPKDVLSWCCFCVYLVSFTFRVMFSSRPSLYRWFVSQAESRDLNLDCIWGPYDKHDFHHFFSSSCFLFLFMTIATINDACDRTPRVDIEVF